MKTTKKKDTVAQVAEGKKFNFLPVSAIRTNELLTFDFEGDTSQNIVCETKEFSAVCPFSGLPDVAYVKIEYKPRTKKCLELKALKYYFVSFRPVGIYQEGVTDRMYKDICEVLGHDSVKITTIYNTRGGFDVTATQGSL